MSWTDERIDLLKRLWGEGQSASQIAGQLGGVTRNAVIGKVHRLKLDSRIKLVPAPVLEAAAPAAPIPLRPSLVEAAPAMREEAVLPRPAAPAPSRPVLRAVSGANALKMEPDEDVAGHVETAADEARPGAEVVPISRNLTLVQLSDRTCKWPLGDPLSAEFRFCGNHSHEASPYCQYHARIAFQPVSERRRVR